MARTIKRKPPGTFEVIAERRVKALELVQAGVSYVDIGKALGVSYSQAYKDVSAAIAKLSGREESLARDIRNIQMAQCDRMIRANWVDALGGDLAKQAEVRKWMDHKAKLTGAYMPLKIDWRQLAEEHGIDPDGALDDLTTRYRAAHLAGRIGGSADGAEEGTVSGLVAGEPGE